MHIRDVKDDELMEKYKKSIKLAERITRYLKGDLSEAEMLVLKKSLKESSDGEQLLTKIRDQKNIAAKQVLYDSFDAKKNWEQIRKAKLRKNSVIHIQLNQRSFLSPHLSIFIKKILDFLLFRSPRAFLTENTSITDFSSTNRCITLLLNKLHYLNHKIVQIPYQ